MDGLPDTVADWRLDVRLSGNHVIHVFDDPDPDSKRRMVYREEHWLRKSLLGRGAFGDVWLQECTNGGSSNRYRAVKRISVGQRAQIRPELYVRELEAVVKFSHRRV
jgi:hypothetical protein